MEVLAVVLKLLASLPVSQMTIQTAYKTDMPSLIAQSDAMKQLLLKSKGKIENGSYYNAVS
jgi:hypothetical protein